MTREREMHMSHESDRHIGHIHVSLYVPLLLCSVHTSDLYDQQCLAYDRQSGCI